MSIQLSTLVPEIFEPKKPKPSEQPGRRDKASEIVTFIRRRVGKSAIARWEFSRAGTVTLYFNIIRHDPNMNAQLLVKILSASKVFNFPFRMFADGNQIAMEILSRV